MRSLIMLFLGFCCLIYAEIKKATYDEVKNSIKLIEKTVKEGKEEFLEIYSEAIEIEKRATTPYLAEIIKNKICKTGKISEKEFEKLREKYSFFDISIGWAINQTVDVPLTEILEEKETKTWEEIFKNYLCGENSPDKVVLKIKELNPRR